MEHTQRGIHWPYCIDGQCDGCMPAVLPWDEPVVRCLPAIGIHERCEHYVSGTYYNNRTG